MNNTEYTEKAFKAIEHMLKGDFCGVMQTDGDNFFLGLSDFNSFLEFSAVELLEYLQSTENKYEVLTVNYAHYGDMTECGILPKKVEILTALSLMYVISKKDFLRLISCNLDEKDENKYGEFGVVFSNIGDENYLTELSADIIDAVEAYMKIKKKHDDEFDKVADECAEHFKHIKDVQLAGRLRHCEAKRTASVFGAKCGISRRISEHYVEFRVQKAVTKFKNAKLH